jgi:ankyrin repeat protein
MFREYLEKKHNRQGGYRMPRTAIAVLFLLGVSLLGCSSPAQTPRAQLAQRNISYDEKSFINSAGKGDEIAVRLFLEAGMPPDTKDQYGMSALKYAAASGQVGVIQLLLDNGARVDVLDNDEFTPLRYAAQYNQVEAVRLLLDHGADPNRSSRLGLTPLMVAASEGHLEAMRLMQEAKSGG